MMMMSPTTTSNNAAEKRQLIKPSKFQQWGVQVVSLVPTSVHEILSDAVGGAVTNGWTAVALPSGKIHAFSVRTSTLSQPLHTAPLGHTLYHPGLASSNPILAISSRQDSATWCCIYAAHPQDGVVFCWRLSRDEKTLVLPRNPQARVRIPLQEDESISFIETNPLVVGTSWGRLFWCTQTPQSLNLHAQPMERPSSSIFGRILSSSAIKQEAPMQSVLALNKHSLLSVSSNGTLEHWKVTTKVGSPQATFQVTPVATLQEAFMEQQDLEVRSMTVLRAACLEQDAHMHGLNFIVEIVQNEQDETRIYWLQGLLENETTFLLGHAIYLNRFHASEVTCVGLVTTHEQVSYAAFQYNSSSLRATVVMALMDDSTVVQEVDLPTMTGGLVVGTMGRDVVTHGWCALATSGLGMRGRWTGLEVEATSATPRKQRQSPSDVVLLSSHLRSAFWQVYQQPDCSMRLPPSLLKAPAHDLEPAILATARQLQHEGSSSSGRNPMEWHASLIQLLQQGGLYRSLSNQGRYSLLGIGQELAVHSRLVLTQHQELEPHGVADWLQGNKGNNAYQEWFVMALETATQYRRDQASVVYDISDQGGAATGLWTHHPTLQNMLMDQLLAYKDIAKTTAIDPHRLETVVRVALVSFAETSGDSSGGEDRYNQVKVVGIPLVRQFVSDAVAFELAVQHQWYEGICQIVLDHENDEDYQMEPLLSDESSLQSGRDVTTGLGFCEFVLQWHADRGLYAQVLNYGRYCPPELLNRFLEKDDRVRAYQWIPAVRNKHYDEASGHLIKTLSRPDATLASSRWSLSMAKLANYAAQQKSTDNVALKEKRKAIDNKMELVQAQELLMENKENFPGDKKNQPLLSPEKLLSMTLDQLEQCDSDRAIELCLIGLAICRSIEESEQRSGMASHIWGKSIHVDMATWMDLVRAQQYSTKEQLQKSILETTVFGRLLKKYQANAHGVQDNVAYDNAMESMVVEKLGLDAVTMFEMKRILRIGTQLVLPTERPAERPAIMQDAS